MLSQFTTQKNMTYIVIFAQLFEISQKISNNLERALQVKLCKAIIPILQKKTENTILLIVYLLNFFLFFNFIQWKMLSKLLLTMVLTTVIDWFTSYTSSFIPIISVYNLSIFFIFLQHTENYLPSEMFKQIIGNIQWIYASLLIETTGKYTQNNVVAIVFLITVVIIMKLLKLQNEQFYGFYTVAASQGLQDLIVKSIPSLFVIPSVVFIIYAIFANIENFKVLENFSGYIIYHAASLIQNLLSTMYPKLMCLIIAVLGLFFFSIFSVKRVQEIAQNLTIIATVDFFIEVTEKSYKIDPIIGTILFIYLLHVFGSTILSMKNI